MYLGLNLVQFYFNISYRFEKKYTIKLKLALKYVCVCVRRYWEKPMVAQIKAKL